MTVCINGYASFCDIFSFTVTELSQADSTYIQDIHSTFEGHKIQLLSISKLFVYCCHSDIDSVLLKTTFSQISIHSQLLVKFSSDRRRRKNTFKAVENIGMASEKLYRNTLTVPHCLALCSRANKSFFFFF